MQVNVWIVILGVVGAFVLYRIAAARIAGIAQVGAGQAEELIKEHNAVVLDVRTHDEYAGGRIPSARHMPLSQIGSRLSELEKFRGRPIVVSCRSGSRSARACKMLKKKGFEDVYNLKGGIRSWIRADYSVES